MAYIPTAWVNDSEPAITAEKLNKMEYGISTAHGIAEGRATVDYVNTNIANEVTARTTYVDNMVNALEAETDAQIDTVNDRIDNIIAEPGSVIDSTVRDLIDDQVSDPDSDSYASIQNISVAAVDTNFSLSALKTNLEASFGSNASSIDQSIVSSVDNEWSLNTLTTNLESTFGTNAANIDTAITSSVNDNFSLSTLKTNLESQFGTNAASISTKLATYALEDDVGAIAQVALDVDGRITGWTAVGSSVSGSAFKINADTFALFDGSNEHSPFAIDATTGLTQFNGIVSFSNVTDTENVATTEDIPTAVSQLTNDSNYATTSAIPTNVSELENDSGYSTTSWVDSTFTRPSEVANAVNTNTTTINGAKITTGSIAADKIITTGLIAENVSATLLTGKTLQSSIFRMSGTSHFENADAVGKYFPLNLVGEMNVASCASGLTYHTTTGVYFYGTDHYSGYHERGLNCGSTASSKTFVVQATANVDDKMSIYYSVYSSGAWGDWVCMGSISEPQSSYGAAAVIGTVTLSLTKSNIIRFAMRSVDCNGDSIYGPDHNPCITGGMIVMASNV